jgi:hypothetical protein
MDFIPNMENSKIWIPEKNYFVLLLPLMAHKSNGGIIGMRFYDFDLLI